MAPKTFVVPGTTAVAAVCIYLPPLFILNVEIVGAVVPVTVEPILIVRVEKVVVEPLID